jgi:hypothetical protein
MACHVGQFGSRYHQSSVGLTIPEAHVTVWLIHIPYVSSLIFWQVQLCRPEWWKIIASEQQLNYQYPIRTHFDYISHKVKHNVETLLSRLTWTSFKSSATFSSSLHLWSSYIRKWMYKALLQISCRREIARRTSNNHVWQHIWFHVRLIIEKIPTTIDHVLNQNQILEFI